MRGLASRNRFWFRFWWARAEDKIHDDHSIVLLVYSCILEYVSSIFTSHLLFPRNDIPSYLCADYMPSEYLRLVSTTVNRNCFLKVPECCNENVRVTNWKSSWSVLNFIFEFMCLFVENLIIAIYSFFSFSVFNFFIDLKYRHGTNVIAIQGQFFIQI